ncbi:DNA replication/checkpoint protein [Dipodascopsis tothii]|uniref:DNA replication/checkpoint protein n=1 Tax=Dipodascopsis tothii TaxID=44089 RepID=UPI0034CE5382
MAPDNENSLRAAIKAWEYAFREEHGRAPGKQDIRDNAEMAAKYKAYHRAKEQAKRPASPVRTSPESRPSSRADDGAAQSAFQTPTKRRRTGAEQLQTPVRSDEHAEPDSSPAVRRRSPMVIGPTPQANGRVLGIFDIEASPEMPTPPSGRREAVLTTPTKQAVSSPRTPGSATPSAYFASAAAFRQTPSPLRPRKTSRSLTAMLAELRQMQDDVYAEEEAVMRELEDNDYHLGETREDDAATVAERAADQPRAYVKKGTQKRTTKRRILRPVPASVTNTDALAAIDEEDEVPREVRAASLDEEFAEIVPRGPRSPTSGRLSSAETSMARKTDNFQRLKLHNVGYKGHKQRAFRRR